ncbi:WD40-repeat-containing domain protein [Fomitopsis serialis]|uniref:WD40-repeat-containing domain protein n=1 Tax=Fomitopsis serialis TaxID=139415 RepID=UPI00200773DC|nr:WD40-repeat-containing domain protein [Neoantrodia serialis]KAH9914567.1 WD40-repeat-containing domain protein [Neoantrodia serialis]
MASTAYVPTLTLRGGHSDTINVLAFSPDSTYLASGGDDGAVIIWDVRTGNLLYRLSVDSVVDSILWHPVHKETIIVGCESGAIRQVRYFSPIRSEVYDLDLGGQANVFDMDYSAMTACLAASIGLDVVIAKETSPNRYSVSMPLPRLQESVGTGDNAAASKNVDTEDSAVALRFDKHGRILVTTYTVSGIVCWDVQTRQPQWRIVPPEAYPSMGHSAISPGFRFIAVHNLRDGVHLYSMGGHEQRPRRLLRFTDQPLPRIALQTAFIHEGRAVVCGTSTGDVCIWQTGTGELFQSLSHQEDIIMAVASCRKGNICYLATGSATMGPETYIRVWRAKIPSLQQRPESFVEAFLVGLNLKSDRLIPTVEELRAVLRTIAVLTISLGLCWISLKMGILVPWGDCGRAMIHGAHFVWSALLHCWRWGVYAATDVYLVGESVARQVLYVASEWVRGQALRALGLPLDIMERLPPPQ